MPEFIRDGKGNGFLARVDNKGRLSARATMISELHEISEEDERAFAMIFNHDIQSADTQEIAGHITYDGSDELDVVRAILCINSNGRMQVKGFFDPEGLSGGASVIPVNLNRGSAVELDATVLDTNGGASPISATSNGSQFLCAEGGNNSLTTILIPVDAILKRTNIIMFTAESPTPGESVAIALYVYVHAEP